MVLKSCWIILFFQFIGFVAIVVMEQGKDILQALSFTADGLLAYHTWFALFAAGWWGWQSWRASRLILHFTTFDFIKYNQRYALRAQVLIPRILGVLPILILAYGTKICTSWSNPLVYVLLCLAFWMYAVYHLRKDIVVYFLSRNKWKILNIPDYVQVKNAAYPPQFIWKKQGRWILFRLLMVVGLFSMVIASPVRFSQFLGSASIILYALGAWLVVATILDYGEKRFRFPFTFTIVVMVIGFSFFNNNHNIRTLQRLKEPRPDIASHFDRWYTSRYNGEDTVPVYMVVGQGGGVRSAYWLAQVLGDIQTGVPHFDSLTYAYSCVSGGSLGVVTYKQLLKNKSNNLTNDAHTILSKDFLAPVTSWLVMPDLIQKFLPFPIYKVDRARALEYSWEAASKLNSKSLLSDGFINTFGHDDCVYLLNATRVENGFRTLISNVKTPRSIFSLSEDFFDITQQDIPISTAASVSARFPFITPPAVVYSSSGQKWGHLVDGGYIENMGATAMLELYDYLRKRALEKNYKVKFNLLFVKNTKVEYSTQISGMYEVVGPLNTFSKVWINSGYYDLNSTQLKNLYPADKVTFINLDRTDNEIIPLGWYLSPKATEIIQGQVGKQTQAFKKEIAAR